MKLHNMEGTPQEICDFFQNNGLNMADFFTVPEKPMSVAWVILPGVLAFLSMAVLIFNKSLTEEPKTALFVFAAACSIWAGVAVQVRHKNTWAAGFVIVGGLLLTLVANGILTPKQMYQEVKSLKKDDGK